MTIEFFGSGKAGGSLKAFSLRGARQKEGGHSCPPQPMPRPPVPTEPQRSERTQRNKPDHPAALNGLGQIHLGQGKYQEAEAYFLKASPKAPAAWHGLARLYLLQDKFEQAEQWAQAIVDSGQGDESARAMLKAAKEKSVSAALRLMIEPQQ